MFNKLTAVPGLLDYSAISKENCHLTLKEYKE